MRARAARSPSGAPSTCPVPDVGSTSASSILIEVVLPAPFGPRNPKISPAPTRSDRSATATVAPNCLRSAWVSIDRDGLCSATARQSADRVGHLQRVLDMP